MNRPPIAILGAGNVGMALARALVAKGEPVIFGVPDPAKYGASVASLGTGASIGTTQEAIAASDLIILPHRMRRPITSRDPYRTGTTASWSTPPIRWPRDSPACRWAPRAPARKRSPGWPTARAW
jgi:hypothetical protein